VRPPYDPRHVERVTFGTNDSTVVIARCSCGVDGDPHPLNAPNAAGELAADFNAHRATYAAAVPA